MYSPYLAHEAGQGVPEAVHRDTQPVGPLFGIIALLSSRPERDVDQVHLLVHVSVPGGGLLPAVQILENDVPRKERKRQINGSNRNVE